ncbi:MAG TPA: AAA family ATPase, partial [Solirubrobacteraceae bacterium]|nr:AAA family ATPase [Solirubrobacteraceae bacterium]
TVNFRNTVIIMTSNIGSLYLLDGIDERGEIMDDARERVFAELRGHFRPEFLNRVDETVLFKPLTLQEIERIVDLSMEGLRRRLADRRIMLELSEPARALIARNGYDPVYGARPLRRYIQRVVETQIGRALLSGQILDGATITLDSDGEELVVTWRNEDRDAASSGGAGREEPVGAGAQA